MTWWHYRFNVNGDGLSTAHGDAWLLPTLPSSSLLNATDTPAKSRGGNSFYSSGFCTGTWGFFAPQPCRTCLTGPRFSFFLAAWGASRHFDLNCKLGIWRGCGLQGRHWWNSAMNWLNECKFSTSLLRELNWQIIHRSIFIPSAATHLTKQLSSKMGYLCRSWTYYVVLALRGLLCNKILQKKGHAL